MNTMKYINAKKQQRFTIVQKKSRKRFEYPLNFAITVIKLFVSYIKNFCKHDKFYFYKYAWNF